MSYCTNSITGKLFKCTTYTYIIYSQVLPVSIYMYIHTHIYTCICTYCTLIVHMYLMEFHGLSQFLPLKVSFFPCVLRIVHGTVLQRCRQCRRVQRHSTLERLVVESFSFNFGAIWDEGSARCNFLHIVYIMYIRYVFLIQYIIFNYIYHIYTLMCVCMCVCVWSRRAS